MLLVARSKSHPEMHPGFENALFDALLQDFVAFQPGHILERIFRSDAADSRQGADPDEEQENRTKSN